MYKLNPSKDAVEFWNKLDAKQYRQIGRKIVSLMSNPHSNDTKALTSYPDYYRADVGEYRIIYQLKDDCLNLIMIGKRNDDEVYEQFKRKVN